MKALQTDFLGDANLGIFSRASDGMCLVGLPSEKIASRLEETLKVDAVFSTVSNSEIVGVFSAMNSRCIVLPHIVRDSELASIRKSAKKFDVNVEVVDTRFTALGNLVCCNDKGAVISRLISEKERLKIAEALEVPVEYATVAGLDSVGSCCIATNRGVVAHRDATEEELQAIGSVMRVKTDISTANFGSPFLGGCGVANSNGLVVGSKTTGPEITRIMESLDLL